MFLCIQNTCLLFSFICLQLGPFAFPLIQIYFESACKDFKTQYLQRCQEQKSRGYSGFLCALAADTCRLSPGSVILWCWYKAKQSVLIILHGHKERQLRLFDRGGHKCRGKTVQTTVQSWKTAVGRQAGWREEKCRHVFSHEDIFALSLAVMFSFSIVC